jgi:hypothetical protein
VRNIDCVLWPSFKNFGIKMEKLNDMSDIEAIYAKCDIYYTGIMTQGSK